MRQSPWYSVKDKSKVQDRAFSLVLCDDLEGWDGGGGREAQEEGDICIHIAVSHCVQQKLTQHCKAITLQLKKKKNQSL